MVGTARASHRRAVDLLVSFALVFVFCLSMIFLSTQINWKGQILDEGPRLCLQLADRIGAEIGPIGRAIFLLGFWGAASRRCSACGTACRFCSTTGFTSGGGRSRRGQQGRRVSNAGRAYLTLAAISALVIRRRSGSSSFTPSSARCSSRS